MLGVLLHAMTMTKAEVIATIIKRTNKFVTLISIMTKTSFHPCIGNHCYTLINCLWTLSDDDGTLLNRFLLRIFTSETWLITQVFFLKSRTELAAGECWCHLLHIKCALTKGQVGIIALQALTIASIPLQNRCSN